MKLLAIDTSTEALSVAVLDGEAITARHAIAPRRHAELVLPWCNTVLTEAGVTRAGLDAIAVGRGPGAFTGVRLGIAVAQGLALGLGLPVLPVSTLALLAAGLDATPGTPLLAAIDARMGEVYFATFRALPHGVEATSAEQVGPAAAVQLTGTRWLGAGTGFAARDGALIDQLQRQLLHVEPEALPRADVLARVAAAGFARGEAVAPEALEPAYLRNNVALTLEEQAAARKR